MPAKRRHRKARSNGSGRGSSGSGIVRVPFRYVRYFTTAASNWNVAYVQLRPDQLGNRLTNIKNSYQLFRCTALKLKSVFGLGGYTYTPAIPDSATHALAFNQEYLPSNPAFFDSMSEFCRFEMGNGYQTVSISLKRSELIGQDPLKWWRTDQDEPSGTAPEDFTTQAYLYWANYSDSGTGINPVRHFMVVEGIMEFCQPYDATLSLISAPAVKTLPVKALQEPSEERKSESSPPVDDLVLVPSEPAIRSAVIAVAAQQSALTTLPRVSAPPRPLRAPPPWG